MRLLAWQVGGDGCGVWPGFRDHRSRGGEGQPPTRNGVERNARIVRADFIAYAFTARTQR